MLFIFVNKIYTVVIFDFILLYLSILRFFACPYCIADSSTRGTTFESFLVGGVVLVLFLLVGGFILFYAVSDVKNAIKRSKSYR